MLIFRGLNVYYFHSSHRDIIKLNLQKNVLIINKMLATNKKYTQNAF